MSPPPPVTAPSSTQPPPVESATAPANTKAATMASVSKVIPRETSPESHGLYLTISPQDFYLMKHLHKQRLPPQYLLHSTTDLLPIQEREQRDEVQSKKSKKQFIGVVVSAGLMQRTVKVRIPGQRWEPKIGKHYRSHTDHLVHDPNSSLLAGDVVELHRLVVSKAVKHVVGRIVTPFGKPVHQRPPIPSPDERLAAYKAERFAKYERRRQRQIAELAAKFGTTPKAWRDRDDGLAARSADGEGAEGGENVVGDEGQALPQGVRPGGKQEVGSVNARAKQDEEKANGLVEEAARNRGEAEEREKEGELQKSAGLADEQEALKTREGQNL